MLTVILSAALVLQPGGGEARLTVEADDRVASTIERDSCPYRSSFVQLRDRVRGTELVAALAALYAYAEDPANENADACQSLALDAEIGARERGLVTLRLADGRSLPAQASYRCEVVAPKTTACNGVVEDATARPFSAGVEPVALRGPITATLRSALPGATLEAAYRVRVADLLDGGGAQPLPAGAPVTLAPNGDLMATIAIYRASRAGKFRKFVWYYR